MIFGPSGKSRRDGRTGGVVSHPTSDVPSHIPMPSYGTSVPAGICKISAPAPKPGAESIDSTAMRKTSSAAALLRIIEPIQAPFE